MFKTLESTSNNKLQSATTLVNAMTIDVEDYFQVSAFKTQISPSKWDSFECRVEQNTNLVLDILLANQVKATFFTLGWVADRYPKLIRRIVSEGHELASHGYGHQMITDLTPSEFKDDILRAKKTLENISGTEILGYRAPSFSVGKSTLWAHDILAESGYRYSSSVYPIKHDLYGMPDAPRFAHRLANSLVEIPATSIKIFDTNFPASGGGFFRLFPLWLSKSSISRVNVKDAQSAVFYCHPWEFDPNQPRITNASVKSKFRHYVNLKVNANKFDCLLRSFSWAPMKDVFDPILKSDQQSDKISIEVA
jgi:polysaccharide deacetylase family protein (PEP-CTERM system associated)